MYLATLSRLEFTQNMSRETSKVCTQGGVRAGNLKIWLKLIIYNWIDDISIVIMS